MNLATLKKHHADVLFCSVYGILSCLLLLCVPAHAAPRIISVLEFCDGQPKNDGTPSPLNQAECFYASNEARRAASDYTVNARTDFAVMTRENIGTMLENMGRSLATCDISGCAVDILRELNADYGVVGDVTKIGNRLVLQLQIYDVKTGGLLKSTNDQFDHPQDLANSVYPKTLTLLQQFIALRQTQQDTAAWVPWVWIGSGVALGTGGYVADRILPTASNNAFDVLDVLPVVLYSASAASLIWGAVSLTSVVSMSSAE